MLYQRAPLAAEHEYFLDCACECDEINAFDHAVLTLLGDREVVANIIDRAVRIPHILRDRQARCLALDAYAHEMVADLCTSEKQAFLAAGMLREPLKLYRLAEFLAWFNHEDQTTGGAALPYRRFSRCDRSFDPTPRARRHLYSPSAIRRYSSLEGQSVPLARKLATGMRLLPTSPDPKAADLIFDLLREQRESHRDQHRALKQAFEAEQRRKYGFHSAGIQRSERKAVRRAALFAAGIIGARQVSAFAQGQAITLEGRTLTLQVARSRSVAALGHGALDVGLCDRDGTKLAQVCVYFDKTPALDQVAALALHIGAGAEDDIISTGNLFAVTPDGAAHPIVKRRLAASAKSNEAVMDGLMRHGLSQNDHDRKRAAQQRYATETMPIYFEAVLSLVWGRDAPRLEPFSHALAEMGIAIEGRRNAA
jgi:hypothetical protein